MKKESSSPLVSVLMTAYNREKYIAEAIESVLASTYPNFELIIVDDGSTDDTVEIIKGYLKNDQRIQLHINENNLGDYPNRNKAVSLARGKYIMFCDSDDSFFEDSIEYCVEAMEKYPESKIGMYNAGNEKKQPFVLSSSKALFQHFFQKPFLTMGPGGTILCLRFLKEIGGYPEKYGPANDMYFNLKACSQSAVLLLPKLFLNYRIHDGQEKNNDYSYLYNNFLFLNDALSELDMGLTKSQVRYLEKKNNRRFSVNLLQYSWQSKSIKQVKKAWKLAGFSWQRFLNGIFHL